MGEEQLDPQGLAGKVVGGDAVALREKSYSSLSPLIRRTCSVSTRADRKRDKAFTSIYMYFEQWERVYSFIDGKRSHFREKKFSLARTLAHRG